jgi:hypothetical protein
MGERVVVHQTVERLCKGARHLARTTGARAIQQALGPLTGKTLPPLSQGGSGAAAGGRDGVHGVACDDRTDGLRPAKDTGLFGLLKHGLSGHHRLSGKGAVEGTHRLAP